jgi:tetratricopeptide (TPR) repeat protein
MGAVMAEDPDIDLPQGEPAIPADLTMSAALDEASKDPGLRPHLEELFTAQTELLRDQRHHMAKQFVVELGIKKLERWAKRLKVVLQLMTAAVGALAAGLIAYFVWSAHEDHGLVVDSFSAPPGLEAKGLTSQAIAEDFVSRLSAIRNWANQHSITYTQDVRGSDSDAIKIELPETGVSLVEVDRWMRGWLGHQTHIKGSLRDDGDGKLSLVVAAPHLAPVVVKGDVGDIDGLIQTGAEKAFQLYDPINYVVYLGTSGRLEEASQAAEYNLARSQTDKERAAAYTILAFEDGDVRRGYVKAMAAVRMDPSQMITWMVAALTACNLGRDELCLALHRRALQTKKRDSLPGQAGAHEASLSTARGRIADLLGDFQSSVTMFAPGATGGEVLARRAVIAARIHDGGAAQANLDQATAVGGASSDTLAEARLTRLERLGGWPAAAAEAQAIAEAAQGSMAGMPPAARSQAQTRVAVVLLPRLARAQALSGQADAGAATIGQTPTDCYLCLRVRGQVAQTQGRAGEADRWFAEAVRQGPSLPDGYLDWGVAKLGWRDFSGAIALFKTASQKGPRYADPLERWGEALLAEGDSGGAAAKFAAAARIAPDWGRNHLRWGEALMLSRHYREARAQYEIANALDLSKPDRAALNVLLARTESGPLHG